MLSFKAILISLVTLVAGFFLVYYLQILFESYTDPESWKSKDGSPTEFAFWYLCLMLGLIGYISARIAKKNEILHGLFVSLATLLFFILINIFSPTFIRTRFPIPRIGMFFFDWSSFIGASFMTLSYFFSPLIGASKRKDKTENQKSEGVPNLGGVGSSIGEHAPDVIDYLRHLH